MNLLKSTGTFGFYTIISRLLGYLIGKTWDKDKDNKKLLDINCRKDLGLSQIYNKNECEEYCDLCDEVNDVKKSNSLTSHNLVNNDKCIVRFD